MFTCIATLWDWLDSPPLFTNTMESKKLQQLQQANSHIAPHQKKIPLTGGYQSIYQTNKMGDYHHPSQSPVFQQYQSMSTNFGQMNLSGGSSSSGQLIPSHHHHQTQNQYSTNQSTPSSGSQLTPIDTPPQPMGHHNMLVKSGAYMQQQNHHSPYGVNGPNEQLYQTSREARSYQINASGRTIDPITGDVIPAQLVNNTIGGNPVTALQQSYQQLQQAKLHAQIQTQNEALMIQQRTFAMRQALNPPIPHFHLQSQQNIAGMVASASMQSQQLQQQQQQQQQQQSQQTASHRNAPPSTLNLSSQFQPAQGPMKINSLEQQHRQQQQQHQQLDTQNNQTLLQQHQNAMLQKHYNHIVATQEKINEANQNYQQNMQSTTDPSPVYIQQNHPGHVVNQACQTQISGAIGGNKMLPQSHSGINQSPQTPTITGTSNTTVKMNQQLKTPQSSTEDSSNSPASTKSPTHAGLDRKKSSGTTQAIKSPITKRPASSPVTLSGWLYKQGSDGLKVWRKRWFVLAEYCLYYYKGPEEEKLLGSILLPSYRVSACLPEDKIYRKYAFKCEHTNMRTYWLAAENSEQMCHWVRALMAATLMQCSSESSDQNSQPSNSSLNNHSGENSDSGIHTFQSSQQSKLSIPHGPITPASDNGGGSSSGGGGIQPLYANAPPKPRRINDGGYSSPSPEHSIDRNESNPSQMRRKSAGMMSPSLNQMQQKSQHHAIYDTRTGNVKSALGIPNSNKVNSSPGNQQYLAQQQQQRVDKRSSKHYDDYRNPVGSSKNVEKQKQQQQQPVPGTYNLGSMDISHEQIRRSQGQRPSGDEIYGSGSEHNIYMQRALQNRLQEQLNNNSVGGSVPYPNTERRTPDAYGRSKSAGRFFSDYEDIYNLMQQDKHLAQQQLSQGDLGQYRRPMSPPSYNSQKHIPSMPSRYTPNHLEPNSSHVNLRSRSSTGLNRPHSADFLEYEARAEAAAAAAIRPDAIRAQRPKSSLDINRTQDSYYYSEESYAEKMRQSALYLQKSPNHSLNTSGGAVNYHNNRAFAADLSPYSTGVNTIGYENPYERTVKRNELLNEALMNQGALSVPRPGHRSHGGGATPTSMLAKEYQLRQMQQNEQFLRSASARLPKKNEELGADSSNVAQSSLKDGERKREESMKRLLEWKQRMLQSPLTRKGVQQSGSPSILKLGSNPNILATHGGSGIQRSRSETHANAGYNSYSSDDEASISIHNVRNLPRGHLHVKPDPSDPNYGYDPYYDPYATTPSDVRYFNERNDYFNQYEPNEYELQMQRDNYNNYPMRKTNSRAEIDLLERETSSQIRNLDVSAGDLLSRSHEELVLLLIQLRRQSSQIARAIEQCCTDIHEAQNRILSAEGLTRAESIQRLDYLKQHLLELEKQYEKSKPLVNLVDNMVKLGSLYRNNENSISRNSLNPNNQLSSPQLQALSSSTSSIIDRSLQQQHRRSESVQLDRLEFSNRLTDRRMLQEEQRFWDGLTSNQSELQSKVRQLYQLDQLLQEESGTLQSLQRDKEDLERALGGLRARIQDSTGPPLLLEAAKKQQLILERELSRVHQLLAENSKKLEQTVASNARLEQELLILRQKLQASRENRGSQGNIKQASGIPSSESTQYVSSTTALLESELRRVQSLVVDMQRQRQDLSEAVKQLTDNSNRLYKEIGDKASSITASLNQSQRGKRNTCWTETDLDSMISIDHTSNNASSSPSDNLTTPLYIDTSGNNTSIQQSHNNGNDGYGLDNRRTDNEDYAENNHFANLSNQEKQEIKTVRIVKRESERRHRERGSTATTMSNQNLDQVMEEESTNIPNNSEEGSHSRSKSLPRTYNDLYSNGQNQNQSKRKDIQSRLMSSNKPVPGGPIRYSDYYTNNRNGVNNTNNSNSYSMSSVSDRNHNYTSNSSTYQNKTGGYNKDKIISSSNSNRYNMNHHRNSLNGEDHLSSHHSNDYRSLQNQCKTESMQSLNKSITDLSPVFQSEAARQIISEMSAGSASEDNGVSERIMSNSVSNSMPLSSTNHQPQHKHRRAIPREKRRHNTAPNNVNQKAMQKVQAENDMNRNNTNWRARDDLDMEVALRPRNNAPDVVRSALGQGEKISENTIDRLFGAPNKILIPERYIPEKAPELSPEEKKRRQEKVEAIKKMLSEAPINSSNDTAPQPPSKINEEKKQREHLLQLNQILAQQVMQMSKIVAGNPSQSNQNQ